ncbi:hypothetical protein M501DRAFT_994028 [Patellaria atrata CBS 101060]|uniref:F-box domain-containing protein n=1 Tax=Patellaria atrata CBS 101060 TaxID=1346257 RepID=A0A9P4SKC2_9PEZI|nr:hypothetical protein M501DRAFT_994028 [Patellaria atrata CBS 101060]
MARSSPDGAISITLLDLFSNSLVLHQTAPYLSVSSLFALGATCRSFQNLVLQSPEPIRHLDLSPVKSAITPDVKPLDSGGINWRAERMDESLTEDDFYTGPLRGIFSNLGRRNLLVNVNTLVLDGLSVTAEIVREIICEDRFNVRILSIREAKNLNERKLMQVLKYAVRPSRPKNTPRLRGLYFFTPRDKDAQETDSAQRYTRSPVRNRSPVGITSSQGAQIGAEWNQRSIDTLTTVLARTNDKWYKASGRILPRPPIPEWAETLQACEGIIHFDAVICRGPRHNADTAVHQSVVDPRRVHPLSYLPPAIATVALGPSGCTTCHSCPEGAGVFGESPSHHLPLLAPPPLHSTLIRVAQGPSTIDGSAPPPLIVRCEGCLRGRWCERCNKWWDESCFYGSLNGTRTHMQQLEYISELMNSMGIHQHESDEHKLVEVKVHMGLCIENCLVGEMIAGAGSSGMWG